MNQQWTLPTKLWWPQGAGGMWLNYLIWSSKTQQTIPGSHVEFNYMYLKNINPEYDSYVEFVQHLQDYNDCTVRIGNNQCWFNFYLNICIKKINSDDHLEMQNAARLIQDYDKNLIPFNLDWLLIFNDPEKFLHQFNSITIFNLKFDNVVETAFKQYQKSCLLVDLDSTEFQNSLVYDSWRIVGQHTYGYTPEELLEYTQKIYCKPENFLL